MAYSGSDGATATAESVSQGFRVFCMLKTAPKCTQTYHFGDKNDFFSREVPSPLHHTPLPSTPTAHRPHPTFLNEILNTPLVSIFTFIIVRQSFHLQRQNLTSAAAAPWPPVSYFDTHNGLLKYRDAADSIVEPWRAVLPRQSTDSVTLWWPTTRLKKEPPWSHPSSVSILVFNVPLDALYTSFRGRFYGSRDPTKSVIALTDNG